MYGRVPGNGEEVSLVGFVAWNMQRVEYSRDYLQTHRMLEDFRSDVHAKSGLDMVHAWMNYVQPSEAIKDSSVANYHRSRKFWDVQRVAESPKQKRYGSYISPRHGGVKV
jgi:hypothetical protein